MDDLNVFIATVNAALDAGVKDVTKSAVKDAYQALKNGIHSFFQEKGADNKVSPALAELENNPSSNARKEVLKEELESAKLVETESIKELLALLIESLEKTPEGKVQLGKYNTVATTNTVGILGDNAVVHGNVTVSR